MDLSIEYIVNKALFPFRNRFVLMDLNRKAVPARVNIDYWSRTNNVGDAISPVIVEHVLKTNFGLQPDRPVSRVKHLYAVGSTLTSGIQDCCVWGSGIGNLSRCYRLEGRKLDIRLVRGPLTRVILQDYGYCVPAAYGDPGILLPDIYNPETEKQYAYGVIRHATETDREVPCNDCLSIDVRTRDYKGFVDRLKSCRTVISSSLHGIILAEAYGIPAILLRPRRDLFKYYDWYYSTGRQQFPIAESVEQAFVAKVPELPNLQAMKKTVYDTFPIDLYEL